MRSGEYYLAPQMFRGVIQGFRICRYISEHTRELLSGYWYCARLEKDMIAAEKKIKDLNRRQNNELHHVTDNNPVSGIPNVVSRTKLGVDQCINP
jgi:hypothetical protein